MIQTLTKTIFLLSISILLFSCNNSKKKIEHIAIGQEVEESQNELQESIALGKSIYADFCIQCHLANGKGILNNFPPLDGSNWLSEKREESIKGVKFGQTGEIIVNGIKYNSVMAPMGLSNKEIADVMNYVMNSWNNSQDKMVTEEEVSNVEK